MMLSLLIVGLFCICVCAYSGLYYDNGDMTVIDKKMSRNEQKELEEDILHLLGLHRPPRPLAYASKNSAPKFLMDVYQSLESGESNFNFSWDEISNIELSDFIMCFLNHGHGHAGSVEGIRHHKDQLLWFDLSEVPVTHQLLSAELKLYKRTMVETPYRLDVYSIQSDTSSLSHIASVNTSHLEEGWITVNLTEVVRLWLVFPRDNKGLYLKASNSDGEPVPLTQLGIVGSKGVEDRQPFLAAFFSNPSLNQRRRRSTRKKSRREYRYAWNPDIHTDRRRKRTCQKLTLFVSFRDLKWQDWIIAPDGYAAFYCSGECTFPLNTHLNATNHAIVQTLVNLMNPFIVPKPRCAPTKLSPISVLYYDDNNNVILRKYKNMVVKSCGCH